MATQAASVTAAVPCCRRPLLLLLRLLPHFSNVNCCSRIHGTCSMQHRQQATRLLVAWWLGDLYLCTRYYVYWYHQLQIFTLLAAEHEALLLKKVCRTLSAVEAPYRM